MRPPTLLPFARALACLAFGLILPSASAQHIGDAIVDCAPNFAWGLQVADDDPFTAYAMVAGGPSPTYRPWQLTRVDLKTGAQTVLRTLGANVSLTDGSPGFAVVPKNSAEIYVADADDASAGRYAIYRTTDGGTTWAKVRADASGSWIRMFVSADGSFVSYRPIHDNGGISRDHGNTWQLGNVPTYSYEELGFSRANPAVVYHLSNFYGRRSTDRGLTWTDMALRGYQANLATLLRVDQVDPNTIYAMVGGNSGLHFQYSRNGGDDWTQLPAFPGQFDFGISVDTGGLLYTYDWLTTKKYYRSSDFGQTWQRLTVATGVTSVCGNGADMQVGPTIDYKTILYPQPTRLVLFDTVRAVPGQAAIVGNTYGPLLVSGATLNGNTITAFTDFTVIRLGALPGTPGSSLELDFAGLDLAEDHSLLVLAGAAGQTVILRNVGTKESVILGSLFAGGTPNVPPAQLVVQNPHGFVLGPLGEISASAGLTVTALGSTWFMGEGIRNAGSIEGGASLTVRGASITGGGAFVGDAILLSTFGNANNPVHGAHYLLNGLNMLPGSSGKLALTLNAYGASPQFINVALGGDATVSMPSAWGAQSNLPPNSAPLPAGAIRPPGAPEPAYGGGSIIVQGSGKLTLAGGASNDFAFPGGIAFIGAVIDVNGVLVNQGWTTTGRSFQGVFFEAPTIVSASTIAVLGNDLNWINFSTMPHAPVRAHTLRQQPDGSAAYVAADGVATYINTYSTIVNAAANGECWTCLVDPRPVDLTAP